MRQEKKEKKHKHKEKDRVKDKDREKSRHREKDRHADDEGRGREGRSESPSGRANGAAKGSRIDAAELEQPAVNINGDAELGKEIPRRREEDERHSHRSSRGDPSRRDRDRDADRDRRRDRSRDRHRDRDRERDRDMDRRRDRSRDLEKERAASKPRESARTPAPAAAEPEDEQKAPVRQPSPPMSSSAREAEPPVVQESGGEVSMSIEETNKYDFLPLATYYCLYCVTQLTITVWQGFYIDKVCTLEILREYLVMYRSNNHTETYSASRWATVAA